MGVSGVGKSAVGRLLAARLGVEYADGDSFHPAASVAAMQSGHPLSEEQRRPWLGAVADWLHAHDASGGVISCSALRRSHRDLLTRGTPRVTFLHLTGDPELIRRRMDRRHHFMPASLLESQLAILEPPGDDERHVTLDVADTPDQVVEAFLKRP
jgi:gluconokinase